MRLRPVNHLGTNYRMQFFAVLGRLSHRIALSLCSLLGGPEDSLRTFLNTSPINGEILNSVVHIYGAYL